MNAIDKTKVLAKRAGRSINKNATTWLTIGSAIGFVATVVVACKQTTKVQPVLEEHKKVVENIHNVEDKMPKEEVQKAKVQAYAKTAGYIVKIYAVPAIIGTLTLIAMFESDNISRKRKLEASAAYAALNKAFQNYRENVIERYGDEIDEKIRCGVREKEVTETKIKKDGTEVTKTKKIEEQDPNAMNPYYFFFQEGVDDWTKDANENKRKVFMRLHDCLTIYQGKHYITWNDIRRVFHLGPVPGGDTVGLVWDDTMSFSENSDFFERGFGFKDVNDDAMRRFGNGDERNVLIQHKYLDYNINRTMTERLYAKHKRERNLFDNLTDDVEQDILDGKISL